MKGVVCGLRLRQVFAYFCLGLVLLSAGLSGAQEIQERERSSEIFEMLNKDLSTLKSKIVSYRDRLTVLENLNESLAESQRNSEAKVEELVTSLERQQSISSELQQTLTIQSHSLSASSRALSSLRERTERLIGENEELKTRTTRLRRALIVVASAWAAREGVAWLTR